MTNTAILSASVRTARTAHVSATGELVYTTPSAEIKTALKAAGLPAELLPGSGDLAACVRACRPRTAAGPPVTAPQPQHTNPGPFRDSLSPQGVWVGAPTKVPAPTKPTAPALPDAPF